MAALLITPAAVFAQQAHLSLEVAGGANIPAGDAALAADNSVAVSIGLVHRLSPRIALVTELQAGGFDGGPLLDRVNTHTTDISVFRWALGADVSLLSPTSTAWELHARVTGGVSTVVTDPIIDPDRPPRFIAKINDDVLVLSGGLQLVRSLGGLKPFVRVQPDFYFLGPSLGELQALNDEIGASGVLIGIPVQIGLRIGF